MPQKRVRVYTRRVSFLRTMWPFARRPRISRKPVEPPSLARFARELRTLAAFHGSLIVEELEGKVRAIIGAHASRERVGVAVAAPSSERPS